MDKDAAVRIQSAAVRNRESDTAQSGFDSGLAAMERTVTFRGLVGASYRDWPF
jgi:hypothetical protein